MINLEPRGFLKHWLNSHANNALLENVLKQLFRSYAHFYKINSVNKQLINCCTGVSDTRCGANDFRGLDLFQHLCLHTNNVLFSAKSSAYFSVFFPQGRCKNNFRREYQSVVLFCFVLFHYWFQILYWSWRFSPHCLWESVSQLSF